ncbi:hypothetical protein RHMOL_Rhmol02G0221400 [Rhododendron molle]|uniref:Uncharacterized protein n=1 Tax=Rhododendron molle TaxID=49168 RepID=A0ACC0PVL9_RHOML|nr:hypothetical protein RHMOL_Rhmol02G0221400 [Rhododendron molle]
MTKKSSSNRMSMSEICAKWKDLGDNAKQKYIEKAKLSSEEYKEQKVKVDPQETSKVDRKLCEELVNQFDPILLCLSVHDKSLIITPLDVHRILELPCEVLTYQEKTRREAGADDLGYLRLKWGNHAPLSRSLLLLSYPSAKYTAIVIPTIKDCTNKLSELPKFNDNPKLWAQGFNLFKDSKIEAMFMSCPDNLRMYHFITQELQRAETVDLSKIWFAPVP